MFHRIVDDFHIPSIIVKRKIFENTIKDIKKNHSIIPFDDGWMEFRDGVYQLLKELDEPATVFLITSASLEE